jgi:hypothetical protein
MVFSSGKQVPLPSAYSIASWSRQARLDRNRHDATTAPNLQFGVFSLGHRDDRPTVERDESPQAKPLQKTTLWQRYQ